MASIICSSNPKIFRKPSQFHTLGSRNLHRTCNVRLRIRHATAIKASINLPFVKPIESDRLPSDVRNKTMDALDACGGFRVTVGNVSGKAGVSLNEAEKALQALAVDTNGFMEVSDEGDVLYVFSTDYRSKLVAKLRVQHSVDMAKSTVDNIVRVSVGATLVVSAVVVFAAIIVIVVAAAKDGKSEGGGRRRDDGDSFAGAGNILELCNLGIFRHWNPPSDKTRVRTENDQINPKAGVEMENDQIIPNAGVQTENDRRMNFLESVFSFVFGDRGGRGGGNEEERWKLIGQFISSNGGVVTAEELAPFLDLRVIEKMKMGMNIDSYILPVLLRFDGRPEVDGIGNILYRFPSLQYTAEEEKIVDAVFENQKFFMEKKWQFSKTSKLDRVLIIGLAGFNLLGIVYLGTLLKSATVTAMPSKFISFVSAIFPFLQIYAAAFFVVPLVRWLFIKKINFEIEKRNRVREECARGLQSPDDTLRIKLLNARDISQRTFIGQDRIVYSTERDLDAQEWDRRFNHDIGTTKVKNLDNYIGSSVKEIRESIPVDDTAGERERRAQPRDRSLEHRKESSAEHLVVQQNTFKLKPKSKSKYRRKRNGNGNGNGKGD